MSLRDAREEVRLLYASLRDYVPVGGDALTSHITEAASAPKLLESAGPGSRPQSVKDRERTVGLMV